MDLSLRLLFYNYRALTVAGEAAVISRVMMNGVVFCGIRFDCEYNDILMLPVLPVRIDLKFTR